MLLTKNQARVLSKLALRYRSQAKLRRTLWRQRTADELWLTVVSQNIVPGGAAAGETLRESHEARRNLSLARLRSFGDDKLLRRHIHGILHAIGTRFVGKSQKKAKKTAYIVGNFRVLEKEGGPKRFFAKVASLDSTDSKAQFLQDKLKGYKRKSARDTLIELGLAKNCMAIDRRIQVLLKELGLQVGFSERMQGKIEEELIQRVAGRVGLSGAELDRILFQNFRAILADIRLRA